MRLPRDGSDRVRTGGEAGCRRSCSSSIRLGREWASACGSEQRSLWRMRSEWVGVGCACARSWSACCWRGRASEHRKPIHSQPRRSSRWKMLSATELRSEADVLRSGRAMRQCVWRAACSQPARGPCFFWLLKVTDGPAKYQRGHRIPRPRRNSTVRGWAVLNFGAGSIFEKNVNPHLACKSIVSGVGYGKSQKKKRKKKKKKKNWPRSCTKEGNFGRLQCAHSACSRSDTGS